MPAEPEIEDLTEIQEQETHIRVNPYIFGCGTVVGLLLGIVGAAVFAAASWPWWLGFLIGFLFGAISTIGSLLPKARKADSTVLESVNTFVDSSTQYSRLANLVSSLSLAAGIGEPEVFLTKSHAANALAIKREKRSSLVVSTALLDLMTVLELEGLVAELVVSLRSGSAEAATLRAAMGEEVLGLGGKIFAPLLTLSAKRGGFVNRADVLIDSEAVALTRYPPGLRGALSKIRASASSKLEAREPNQQRCIEEVSLIASTDSLAPNRSAQVANLESESDESGLPQSPIGSSRLDLRIDMLSEL